MILKGLWLDAMIAASLQTGMFSTFVYSRSYIFIIYLWQLGNKNDKYRTAYSIPIGKPPL